MGLSKHSDDNSLTPSERNKEQYPTSSTDRSLASNDEKALNDESLQAGKEKYLGDLANIEDIRGNGGEPVDENSAHLTDNTGEEKDEEYINTDERKSDLRETDDNKQ